MKEAFQIHDPQAGYAPDFEHLLLEGTDFSGTTPNETDLLYPPLPILPDAATSQDRSPAWSLGFSPNQGPSLQDIHGESSCGLSGMQNSPGLISYNDPYLSESSQRPSLGLDQTFVDPRNLLKADSRLDTLKDDLEYSCILGTNRRKRPPRSSFTAPPSQTRNPPPCGFMEDDKGPLPLSRRESIVANHVSVPHRVPTTSDDFSQRATTANNLHQPATIISQPLSTRNDHTYWDEKGNGSDSRPDSLVSADYTPRYQDSKYSTEHDVEYAYDRADTQPDGVYTPSSPVQSHTTFPSPGTSAPYPRHSSDSPSRKRFRDDCYAWVINDFK